MNKGKFDITGSLIYRWRYYIGYGLVALGLIFVLVFIALYIPGGISSAEMQSVIKSSALNVHDFWSVDVINLPYHLLQHLSIALLGVSTFSIKLPSIILSFLSAFGLVLLLKNWFKPNIAVLASLIAITTGQFLFIAQNGTPDIMFLFWPVLLILIASMIPLREKFRKLLIVSFFVAAALSLYTPLSMYIILVIAGAIILHPHLRYLIKRLSRLELAIGLMVVLIIITPLILALLKSPGAGLPLLGIPSAWPNIWANLGSLGNQYLSFASPGGNVLITPFFELGSILLVGLGVYYVIQTRATSKSYVVTLWTLFLIPIIILNPSLTTITFLPLVLLLASGLNGLLAHWYELFPRNPYARVGGLIPVVILVTVLVLSGVNRYVYGYLYDPNIVPNFSKDIQLIPSGTKNIVVSSGELPFYSVMAKYDKQIHISTSPNSSTFIATHDAMSTIKGHQVRRIITDSNSNQSNRFYLY